MKTIIIFIGLKIAEIAGVCLAYVLISLLGYYSCMLIDGSTFGLLFENWYYIYYALVGLLIALCICCVSAIIYFTIPHWFKSNWEWSKELSKRK